jgi:hypothetical protein
VNNNSSLGLDSSSIFKHSTTVQCEALPNTAHQVTRKQKAQHCKTSRSVPFCTSTTITYNVFLDDTPTAYSAIAKRHLGFGSIIPSRCLVQSLSTADISIGYSIHQPRTTSSILTQPHHCFLSCAYTKFAPIVSQLTQTHFHKSPNPNKYKDRKQLTNNTQPVLPRPLPQPRSLALKPPPLPILRRAQIELLRSTINRRQSDKYIPMLSSLRRRARSLVRHDLSKRLVVLVLMLADKEVVGVGKGSQGHVCGDPVANLAPFGVVAGRSVRVRESDC